MLSKARATRRLEFFGDYQHLADTAASKAYLAPLWKKDSFDYAKRKPSPTQSARHLLQISPQRPLAAPIRPNHCYSRLSPGPALHRRRRRNPP